MGQLDQRVPVGLLGRLVTMVEWVLLVPLARMALLGSLGLLVL